MIRDGARPRRRNTRTTTRTTRIQVLLPSACEARARTRASTLFKHAECPLLAVACLVQCSPKIDVSALHISAHICNYTTVSLTTTVIHVCATCIPPCSQLETRWRTSVSWPPPQRHKGGYIPHWGVCHVANALATRSRSELEPVFVLGAC